MKFLETNHSTAGDIIISTGRIELSIDRLTAIVRRSGRAASFDERMYEAVVQEIAQQRIVPMSHEVLAISMNLCPGTNFLVWDFESVAVSRFS